MAREIKLTQGQMAVVSDEDFETINKNKWFALYNPGLKGYYAVRNIGKANGKRGLQYMHRIILNVPDGKYIDHINHNTLDNRRENLRLATLAQNQWNGSKRCDNKSGYKGVCWHKREAKWCAQINIDGKRTFLGYFSDIKEAVKTYDMTAKKHHGGFALTN